MKSFVFDVWGPAIGIAEQLSQAALNRCIVISARTESLVSGQFALQPAGLFQGMGVSIECFTVLGELDASAISFVGGEVPTVMSTGSDGNFGVYQGSGDSVDREFAIANGFVPVEEGDEGAAAMDGFVPVVEQGQGEVW